MLDFNQLQYSYSPVIVKHLEEIAKLQGKLDAWPFKPHQELEVLALANIDAVHFSTKIEGNKLTIQQVTKALMRHSKTIKSGTRDLKEVINYSRARKMLYDRSAKPEAITLKLILQAHDILLSGIVRGKLKGYLRTAQNIIHDSRSHTIVYMPPVPEDVPHLMKSLIQWLRREMLNQTSSLILAPIFHYAFVTIHPFMDGNGRLARLLTNHILDLSSYNVNRFAALEKQHELNRSRYYSALRSLQSHNFYDIPDVINVSSWIEYWLVGLKNAYEEAFLRLDQNIDFNPENKSMGLPTRLEKAMSLFHKHKTLRAADYEALVSIGRTQAVADLAQLIHLGLIQKIGGGRSTIYRIKNQ